MAYVEISCAEVKKLAKETCLWIDELRARRINEILDTQMREEQKKPFRWWIFKDRARSYQELLDAGKKDWHNSLFYAEDLYKKDMDKACNLLALATESGAATMKITQDEWRLLR